MRSIQDIDTIRVPDEQNLKQAPDSAVELVTGTHDRVFRSFKLESLAVKQDSCLTGMRDELVLLSWCIVLLRTSEEGQVSFEWAYREQSKDLNSHFFNTAQAIPSLEGSVEQVGRQILQHIRTGSSDQPTLTSSPVSLVLSTGLLSQTTSDLDGKVSEGFKLGYIAHQLTHVIERTHSISKYASATGSSKYIRYFIRAIYYHLPSRVI
jgi:hypothetical protein